MAKRQTRRTVSMSALFHAAVTAEAARRGMSQAHFVEQCVRPHLGTLIPEGQHVTAAISALSPLGKRRAARS